MTVAELKQQLSLLDDSMEVLMSSDEEGNEFHYLYSVQVEKCVDWGDEFDVVADEDYEELDEEDKIKAKDYIILWP